MASVQIEYQYIGDDDSTTQMQYCFKNVHSCLTAYAFLLQWKISSNSNLSTPVMLLHIFVVIPHDCPLETGRCTVHADLDRVELSS